MRMPCKLCRERGKTWNGDDPRCAFAFDGRFNRDNWACETMFELRRIAYRLGTVTRDDMECASIGYVPYVDEDSDEPNGYIVMTWYKDRGTTGNAIVMSDDNPIRELTEEMALKAIEWNRRGSA
jgi:hypothetical protein